MIASANMETVYKLLSFIKTPEFWFGGLIVGTFVGLFVNLISPSVNTRLSRLYAKLSKARATRTLKLTQEREERINLLINNTQEQQFSISLATNKKVSAIIRCVAGIVVGFISLTYIGLLLNHSDTSKSLWEIIQTGFAGLSTGVASYLMIMSSMNLFNESEQLVEEAHEARRRVGKKC